MAYATNLNFVRWSGLGIRIVDENVGTGDNSETDFDLDKTNIITGGYVLSYAASGSNTFTALTETTHYTLDKESGRIVLEAAGVTALGTNVLYATYWYTDNFNDDVITDYLTVADDEIDKLTGRKWDSPTSITEYRNGRRSLGYPTTDRPYQADWDAPDFIVLNNWPVTKIDFVHYLNLPESVASFFNYDDTGSTYTDYTDEVNTSTEAPFTMFAAVPATSDAVYIGSDSIFLGVDVNLSTLGTGSPAIDWEYYNGTAWTDLTETDVDSGASTFTANGKFTFSYPFGWSKTTVNSENYYWIRGVVATGYTIAPICATLSISDNVNVTLEPRQILFKDSGELNFVNTEVPNGTLNLRIDYSYGMTTTPNYIIELAVLMASVKAYVNLSGGSYDDATSYSLGSKSVSIGEAYVNIREVISQFKKRIQEIMDMIGKRVDIRAI